MSVWAWDQEKNVRNTRSFIQPHERMKDKRRVKLTDLGDIYLNNQNTGARGVRECILAVLPGWFVTAAEAELKQTLEHGEGKPIEERRTAALQRFAEHNITQAQLEDRIGRPSTGWTAKDLATLTRIYTTITQDGIPVTEFFPEKAVEVPGV